MIHRSQNSTLFLQSSLYFHLNAISESIITNYIHACYLNVASLKIKPFNKCSTFGSRRVIETISRLPLSQQMVALGHSEKWQAASSWQLMPRGKVDNTAILQLHDIRYGSYEQTCFNRTT